MLSLADLSGGETPVALGDNSFQGVVPTQGATPAQLNDYWEKRSHSFDYSLGTPEEKEAIRSNFINEYKYGLGAVNQQEGPSRGSLENLKNIAIESFRSAKDSMQLADDVAKGSIDSNTPRVLAENKLRAAQQYVPPALQETQQTLKGITDDYANAKGFGETALAIGKGVANTLGEIVTNPEGVVQLSTQSSGNMLPSMVGAVAGSKAGAALGTVVAPGAGTLAGAGAGAVGGFIGSLLGGLSTEAGARLIEEAGKELDRLELEPTEANYAAILANKSFADSAIGKSRDKAMGTALVDAALSVGAAKIATGPARTAQKMARMKAGADAPQEVVDAMTKIELKSQAFGTQTKAHLKAYGAEMASEPISELTGQLYVGDGVDAGELAGEFLGGIGSSIVGKHVDTAVFGTKLAAGATAATASIVPGIAKAAVEGAVNTVQDLTTKKTSFRDQMDELHKASSSFGYGDRVTSLAQSGDISKHIDPDTDDYNPHLAIDALATINKSPDTAYETKAENLDQALSITNKFALERKTRMDFQEELEAKNKAKNPDDPITKQEQVALRDLRRIADGDTKYLTKLENITESLSKAGQSIDESKSLLDEAAKASTPEEGVAVLKRIFGSNGGGSIDSLGSSIEAIKSHPNATPETVSFIKDAQAFSTAHTTLNRTYAETSKEVNDNILKGADGWRSVESYTRNIAGALNNNNESFASKELGQLYTFASHQRNKSNTLHAITEYVKTKGSMVGLDPALLASLKAINEIRVTNSGGKLDPYGIHKGSVASGKWTATLNNIAMEADTLEKGLKVATGLFGLHQKKAPAIEIQEATSPVVDIPEVNGTSVSPTDEKTATGAPATSTAIPTASKANHEKFMNNIVGHRSMNYTTITKRIDKAEAGLAHKDTLPEHKVMFQAELDLLKELLTKRTPPMGKPTATVVSNTPTTAVSDEIRTKNDSNTLATESSVKPDSTQLKPAPKNINIYWGSNENKALSNLAPRPFTYGGNKYTSVEHAYQSLKSGKFDPVAYAEGKIKSKAPGRIGTDKATNMALMYTLMLESFKANPSSVKVLLATGNSTLTHTQDNGIWKTAFPKLLMEIRDQLSEPKKEIKYTSKAGGEVLSEEQLDKLSNGTPSEKITANTIKALKGKSDTWLQNKYTELKPKLYEFMQITRSTIGRGNASPKKMAVGYALQKETHAIEHEMETRGISFDSPEDIARFEGWNEFARLSKYKFDHEKERHRVREAKRKGVFIRKIDTAKDRIRHIQYYLDHPEYIPKWSSVAEEEARLTLYKERILKAEVELSNFIPEAQIYVPELFKTFPTINDWRDALEPEKHNKDSKPDALVKPKEADTSSTTDPKNTPIDATVAEPHRNQSPFTHRIAGKSLFLDASISKETNTPESRKGAVFDLLHAWANNLDITRIDGAILSTPGVKWYPFHVLNDYFKSGETRHIARTVKAFKDSGFTDAEVNVIQQSLENRISPYGIKPIKITQAAPKVDEVKPKPTVEVTPAKPEYTNHSGGAIGADSAWGDIGAEYGVKSNHYYKDKTPKGNTPITQAQFIEGVEKAKQAASDLGRTWSNKPFVQGLLSRNWQQVKNADAIFAIGTIAGKYVNGGTGYAVAMAVREGKPIYVFDQVRNGWFQKTKTGSTWEKIDTPVLTPNFAGIGTRGINANGLQAIKDVYAKTFSTPIVEAVVNSKPNESITEEVKPNGKSEEGQGQGDGRLLVKDALDESTTTEDTNGEEVSNESLVVGAQEFTAEEFASLDQSLKDEWTALNEEIALYNAILECVS
jgi:predicted NAD-dependent protein-ADP-ribosyltransferase YbiA (DUF1768 family)